MCDARVAYLGVCSPPLCSAIPGLKEMLDDPEALAEQASKAAELFASFSDPEKAQEMLAQMGGAGTEAMENLQRMLGGEGGEGKRRRVIERLRG